MENQDSNLEWEMALAAAESDDEQTEINKQIAASMKNESSSQKMSKKVKSVP